MRFGIIVAPEAINDLAGLRSFDSATIRNAIETHLRHEPTKQSKSRIKQLRGVRSPQYRLRVGEFRVFYDVLDREVHV